ncbi:DUF6275 family protein [Peptacetobacter sp. AB800]|uniref:DUF6275 family protein n=1 Tax=Peptacetobacter sp. AB800 TaxID=3388428 RepID=UPI0039FCD7F4
MNEKIFIEKARELVYEYTNDNRISVDDVYVVWSCKTLQNNKALLSTPIEDGMYYEITYNGDKNEIYFDAYKKVLNKKVDL